MYYHGSTVHYRLILLSVIIVFLPLNFLYGKDLAVDQFRIEEVIYENSGNTSHNALEKTLRWDYTRIFNNKYELDSYLQQQKNTLINKKIYKSVLSSNEILSNKDSLKCIKVTLKLEEAWMLVPLPYYKYDDNLGYVLGVFLDYKNMGGTLSDFYTSFYYSEIKSDSTTDWLNVRAGPFLLDFRFNQLWETVKAADSNGNKNLIYDYVQSTIRVSMNIPLAHKLSYYLRPILRWPYAYKFELNKTDFKDDYYTNEGLLPAYNHMIMWDGVNWIGNLRQGLEASIENQLEYDFEDDKINLWVDGIFKSYIYTPHFNYSSRLSSFYYYNDIKMNAGDRIRGILDYKLSGDTGYFWNQSLPINVITIEKVTQLQLVPFFDMGLVLKEEEKFSSEDLNYTSGLSLIIFPTFLPSFSLSLDYGINLRDFNEREIRISSELYY